MASPSPPSDRFLLRLLHTREYPVVAAQSEAGVFLLREKLGRGMLCEGTGLRYPLCKSWAEISYLEELGCGALLADGMRIALPQFYFFRVFDFPIQNILKIQCVFVSEQLYFHVIQLYDH
jgi:hypothetical protein